MQLQLVYLQQARKCWKRKKLANFFEALHPLIFHWMECGTNYVATPWQNCIILHIFSLSELCDAMSTKSRKVHHLDCKNRSEKCLCTSNSEVYSHKWITIFYIWISICSLRVAAQEPSFYGIRRWALRVCIGNMTERWLLLLSGDASGICLDEMDCRPFSVFFQKPLHIKIKFLYSSSTLYPSFVLHRDRERWNWILTWAFWNSLIFYFFHTKDRVNSWNILKLCSNTKTIELWHIQKDPASPQMQGMWLLEETSIP